MVLFLTCDVTLNSISYFRFNVVGWHGLGAVPFDAAITAVMIEGAIFLVLAVTGLRFAITKFIPEPMKLAPAPAIGAFLAHLGLQTAEGIGVVVADIATVSFNEEKFRKGNPQFNTCSSIFYSFQFSP